MEKVEENLIIALLAFFALIFSSSIFFRKSAFVTFLYSIDPNFMQKSQENLFLEVWELLWRTDWLTDWTDRHDRFQRTLCVSKKHGNEYNIKVIIIVGIVKPEDLLLVVTLGLSCFN